MKQLHILIAACWALALAPPAPGAEYFVDQGHAAASDENPGAADRPFKTINRSFKGLKPGDTVWVKKGVYRENIMLSSAPGTVRQWKYAVIPSGKSYAQMVNFYAWPGDEVVIKGSDVVAGWTHHKDAIWVKEGWAANSQQVFVDDKPLQQIAGEMVRYLSMRGRWKGRKGDGLADMDPGSFYYDIKAKTLYVWLKDGGDPNAHVVEASVRPFLWFMRALDYIRVVGLKMRHSNTSTVVNWSAACINGHDNIMENVAIEWADFGAMSVSGSNNTLVNCTFNHSGCVGLGARGWGHRFINCETSYNNYRYWSAGWHAGGVKIIPDCHDTVMSGHVAAYNYKSPGIWFDGRNSNVTIQNCISHHNGGAGIMYEISERATIKNNICYENAQRGIYISNSSYCAILHNTCYKNGMSGIVLIGVKRVSQTYGRGKENRWPGGHNVVWGNILMDNCHPDLAPKGWSTRPELILPTDADSNAGNVCDYNLYYRSNGRVLPFWKGWGQTVCRDLEQWRKKTGYDRHSTAAEPKFADLAKRDFHPIEGSPALWLVRPTQSVRFDFEGRVRPRDKTYVTAGAYEGPDGLLKAYLAGKKPVAVGKYKIVMLPPKLRQLIPVANRAFDPLRHAVRYQPRKPLAGGILGLAYGGVPYALKENPEALMLSKARLAAVVPVDKQVRKLHILLAAVGVTHQPLATCTIAREDGHKIVLAWQGGKNIGPSIGEWSGALADLPGKPGKTEIAWSGPQDKTTVRLFHTVWDNENEWYPVKQIEWRLQDAAATLFVLAVTVE